MDKLAKALRDDAQRIDVNVSPELDRRLRASIQNAPAARNRKARKPVTSIGWASALTGAALAAGADASVSAAISTMRAGAV